MPLDTKVIMFIDGMFVEVGRDFAPKKGGERFHPNTVSHCGRASICAIARASNAYDLLYEELLRQGSKADYILHDWSLVHLSKDKSSRSIEADVYVKNPPSPDTRMGRNAPDQERTAD